MAVKNIILCLSFSWVVVANTLFGQHAVYQEIYYGGVTGAGFSPGSGDGTFSANITIHDIPANSTIKKAFLFSGRHGASLDLPLFFNGDPFVFSHSNQVSQIFNSPTYGGLSGVHMLDVTKSVTPSINQCSIATLQFQQSPANRYNDFYLVVIYENTLMSRVGVNVTVNEADFGPPITYSIESLNPVLNNVPVSLSLYSGYICDTITDGEYIFVESINIGVVGGNDFGSGYCGGVIGSFYYENNGLFGLNDDTANSTMSATDGLADISSYIQNYVTLINLNFSSQTPNNSTNPIWGVILAYTTPCDTFTATVSADTAVCANTPLQLQATGGQAYAWLPQVGLSCYNCPNPIFEHDSTINYTVRIWNTDSCSKVLPMRVRVLPPVISTAAVTNSECEQPTGSITLLPASGGTPPYTYSINNQPGGSNPNFTGLAPGIYTLQINDSGGCTWNDTLTIDKNILAQAAFTATPATGFTPLIVQFTNQSTGAANATWITNSDTTSSWHYQHTYTQEGSYPVTLVVWNTDSLCSDTASFTVVTQTEMAIIVPTLWNIGILPQYSLHTTNVKHLIFRLYDDTGRLIIDHELHEPVGLTEVPLSFSNLTRPATATYLYRIEATGLKGEQKVFTGKVVVVR